MLSKLSSHYPLIAASFVGVVLAVCIGILHTSNANAITRIAPDPSDYGSAGGDIRLSLSNIPSTRRVTTIKVPIYVKAPANADPSTISANVELYSFYLTYSGTWSSYRVWFNDGTGGGAGRCLRGTGTLRAGNFTWSSEYGLWTTTVYAVLRDTSCSSTGGQANNAKADFRMRIRNYTYTVPGFSAQTVTSNGSSPSSGGNSWISYSVPDAISDTADSYYFSTDARERGGGWANYRLRFATPCSITADTPGTIVLYDLDSGNSDNNGRTVNVEVYDETTGSNVSLSRSGSRGQNGTYRVTMTFEPGHKYRLELDNIYYWNVLQYRLPYDNIAYVVGCPTGEMSPVLNLSPAVASLADGGSTDALFSIANASVIAADAQTFARIWYENSGNDDTYGSGDDQVWTQTGTYSSVAQAVQQVATQTLTADSARGSRLCVSWELTASNDARVTVDTNPRIMCLNIVGSPRVNVWGSDVRVGSSFVGGVNSLGSGIFGTVSSVSGSWVEYALTAPGAVQGFASQSGAASGVTGPQSDWSKLTFANTPSFGQFTNASEQLGKIPSVRQAVQSNPSGVTVFNNNAAPIPNVTQRIDQLLGNHTDVTGSIVIMTTGTITIDGDITYTGGSLSGSGSLPQIILIGGTINIQAGVHRVDAWLIATDTVSTCSDYAQTALNSTRCNQPLTITGPIMAKTLLLNRTYLDSANPTAPAETLNLRADAYIWANELSQKNGTWQTVQTTELPPRF